MASYPKWTEWLKLRETNARKRAVTAALNGTGPELVGSAATCPSTNQRAMKVAAKTGRVKKLPFREDNDQLPDYSFDRWVQQAKEFGDDVNKMRTNYDGEDIKLDKKKKDAEKKAADEDKKVKAKPEDDDKEVSQKDKDETWAKLRKIHQDTLHKVQPSSKESDDSDD